MDSLFVSHLVPSVQATFSTRHRSPYVTSKGFSGDSFFSRKIKKQICDFHISRSKRSLYQDFQDFAKPLHLLPAKQVTTYSTHSSEEIISSLELDLSTSFYMLELCTSRDFGSCLRDLNAAILICLIDENGRSILQRIPTISQGKNMKISEYIHFQKGSIDTSTFKGPKLEKIAALWIGLESGSWRVNGVCLKVIIGPTTTSAYSTGDKQGCYFSGMQYKFEVNNILLGDGGLSVIELRPTLVTQLSSIDSSPETPSFDPDISKEGSMKEYAALKFSLLLYDFILIITGAAILTVSSNEVNITYSFLVGGIGGFLYLLLLQRSVDGLSVSSPSSSEEDDDHKFEMSPQSYVVEKALMILVPVMLASAVSSKYWMGGQSAVFSSSQIFAGVAGFLACKIAVVLAAFKPIQMCIKENRMPNQDQHGEGDNDGATRSASDLLREDDNDG